MDSFLEAARSDDARISALVGTLRHPDLDPMHYYKQITEHPYFKAISYLRHHVREVSNRYFTDGVGARNIDLFMLTSAVSSPAGPGSDSEPLPMELGGVHTYLVDSSQFGFEPVLVGGIPKAFCYLASMRGENPDARHLNQFYHCEYEAQCTMTEAQQVAEGYVKSLANLFLEMPHAIEKLSFDPITTKEVLAEMVTKKEFETITFDEAVSMLAAHGARDCILESAHGKDITSKGEIELLRLLGSKTPVWVTKYYRDRVPFYQKPDTENPNRVLNADLLAPPICIGGFGGEILGLGQRQDTPEELYDSLRRQNISPEAYRWYIDLRTMPAYKTTSGFGLGIERFISWSLGFDAIYKAILYPRMKGMPMTP